MAISADTEHPEAAALWLDYVVNSEEAGEIFGTTLGFPASETKLAGTTLEGVDAQVADYLDSVADRIGEAPPVPVVGYGSLEQTFWDLGKSIGLGALSVDDAVEPVVHRGERNPRLSSASPPSSGRSWCVSGRMSRQDRPFACGEPSQAGGVLRAYCMSLRMARALGRAARPPMAVGVQSVDDGVHRRRVADRDRRTEMAETARPPFDAELAPALEGLPAFFTATEPATIAEFRTATGHPPAIEDVIAGRPVEVADHAVAGFDGGEIVVSVLQRSDRRTTRLRASS